MKAILFLGTSLVGAQYTAESIKALGYYPVFLVKITDYSGDARRALKKSEYYEADVNSLADVRRAIKEHQLQSKIVAVTSLLDETLHIACQIAKECNILGPDPALASLIDKTKVQTLIPEFSPPSLRLKLSEIDDYVIQSFFTENKKFKEFFLKPAISSGAVGVVVLKQSSSTIDIIQAIKQSFMEDALSLEWIFQPCISGTLFSLEGYVQDNQTVFLGFSKRFRYKLTEVSNIFPVSDVTIPAYAQQQCCKAIEALVQRSKYMNGYFHCEFILDRNNTPYLIDSNMGRIAGAAIVPQLALSYGLETVEIYKHVFDLGLFKGIHTKGFRYGKCSKEPTMSIYYCVPEEAKILQISLPTNAKCFHYLLADNGVKRAAAGTSDSVWVGFIAGFKQQALEEIQNITIHTDKGDITPFYLEEKPEARISSNSNCIIEDD